MNALVESCLNGERALAMTQWRRHQKSPAMSAHLNRVPRLASGQWLTRTMCVPYSLNTTGIRCFIYPMYEFNYEGENQFFSLLSVTSLLLLHRRPSRFVDIYGL
jgi:hypothetical protein